MIVGLNIPTALEAVMLFAIGVAIALMPNQYVRIVALIVVVLWILR